MTDALDLFYKRRSIRKFTAEAISREQLVELLKAGMAGPSAMNAQPWEFVVITDSETINRLRRALVFAKMKPAAVICVLGSRRMQKNKAGERFWVQDCSAASENILLAAQAIGLGGVWIGIHPVHLFEAQVRSILNLPEGVTPLNLLYLGHPAEEKEARTQYEEKRVHWGAFPGGNEIVPEDDNEKDIVEGDHDLSDF